jgi:hypothetical protein
VTTQAKQGEPTKDTLTNAAGLVAQCETDVAYLQTNCGIDEEDHTKACVGQCLDTLKKAEISCKGNMQHGWAFEQGQWTGICDACNQDLKIVQKEGVCSSGPSLIGGKDGPTCKQAGHQCNTALVKAKTSCLGSKSESVMKHYSGFCDGTVEAVVSLTGTTSHKGFCDLLEAPCFGTATDTCGLIAGMENVKQECKSAEITSVKMSCNAQCKDSKLFSYDTPTDMEAHLKTICEDTACTTPYFQSLVDSTATMSKSECANMGSGAEVGGARKQADQYNFQCAKNAGNKYCRTLFPKLTESGQLTCSSSVVKEMKAAGCCFGSMLAIKAASKDAAAAAGYGAGVFKDDQYFDSVAVLAKECGLNLTPCSDGMLIKVNQVPGTVTLKGTTVDQVKTKTAAVKKTIADKMGVKTQNVVITGITASAAASSGRKLTTGSTNVDYTVTAQAKQGEPTKSQLDTAAAAITTDPSALETSVKTAMTTTDNSNTDIGSAVAGNDGVRSGVSMLPLLLVASSLMISLIY